MRKRFRALRIVALLYKAFAWVVLIGGGLFAIVTVIMGSLAGGAGRGPLFNLPRVGPLELLSGLAIGIAIFIGSLLYFVLLYAAGEFIELALAIEENTRETAFYLRGEGALPPSSQGG